jgi:hypothetical protein
MLHSFGRILVVINEVTFLWRKKNNFLLFFVMPLDGVGYRHKFFLK